MKGDGAVHSGLASLTFILCEWTADSGYGLSFFLLPPPLWREWASALLEHDGLLSILVV